MSFQVINVSKWDRNEYFDLYFNKIGCNYSLTLNLDATALLKKIKKAKLKLFPVMIYLISKIVNQHKEFRTSLDAKRRVGVYEYLSPCYTTLPEKSENFTNIWTEYNSSFSRFYKAYEKDIKMYGESKSFLAKPNMPENIFYISSFPWISFTGLNLTFYKSPDYLLPIFTIGKYFEENGKILLPLAIQAHHAVCDGFHVARFVKELVDAMNTSLK